MSASGHALGFLAAIVHVDNRSDHLGAERRDAAVKASSADDDDDDERLDERALRDAMLALTGLGFNKGVASSAIGAALDEEPRSLEQLVFAALRRCPKPSA